MEREVELFIGEVNAMAEKLLKHKAEHIQSGLEARPLLNLHLYQVSGKSKHAGKWQFGRSYFTIEDRRGQRSRKTRWPLSSFPHDPNGLRGRGLVAQLGRAIAARASPTGP